MDPTTAARNDGAGVSWQQRLRDVTAMMRDMSGQSDPQAMVRAYRERIAQIYPVDAFVAISRRDLEPPNIKVTRASIWDVEINPWTQGDRLPVFDRGLLNDLMYAGEPAILSDVTVEASDPLAEFLPGARSLVAIPSFDDGVAKNMVVMGKSEPSGFDPDELPDMVLRTNLFGRATHNLVLRQQLDLAYQRVDEELKTVASIQRSLLPSELPTIEGVDIAAHYETSARAGGDYYDVFPLSKGRWGILIADVCGHGTPAAVLMAITHALAHTAPSDCLPPGELLAYVNDRLTSRYTSQGTFVTAFYAVYDPSDRSLVYASAGHNPPRVKRCSDGSMFVLDAAQSLPLGIAEGIEYAESRAELIPGDQVVLYTDGITEAFNDEGNIFEVSRLDGVLANCGISAQGLIGSVLDAVDVFTDGRPADDDRTLVVLKVR
ncbi:MAG: PP2C family protein-serine/threonine phosphatase [Planctomycetota bacterium]